MATIEADPTVPIIHTRRDFAATPAQLMRAHTDPVLFAKWVGPRGMDTEIVEWDARSGGAWRYVARRDGEEYRFRGCFHTVSDDVIVQTFTWDGQPDAVSLETLRFENLGDGRTRLHAQSLVDSFESRDGWLASGMKSGVDDAYGKLDELLASLDELTPADRHRLFAAGFGEHVAAVTDWDCPTPVDGWVARDVVDHLIDFSRAFLRAGGLDVAVDPPNRSDPAVAWAAHSADMQALLDGPDSEFTHPRAGTHRLVDAIDRFYSTDVFMHTWDLATACGRESGLDPDFAAHVVDGMAGIEEILRSSGQYGPAVPVPVDADPVTRLVGFIGRNPAWHR